MGNWFDKFIDGEAVASDDGRSDGEYFLRYYVSILTDSLVVDDDSDEDVRPLRRRRDVTPFGKETSPAADDVVSEAGSVQFNNVMDSDDQLGSQCEEQEDSDVESVGSTQRRSAKDSGRIGVLREVDDAEDRARIARREARVREDPNTPSNSDLDESRGSRRKRRRSGRDIESDDSDEDIDSVDRMVPFMVNGFCQGCKCKQNVYILGPIRKRRLAEADCLLAAMQERYRVLLVRGERRTVENSLVSFSGGSVNPDVRSQGVLSSAVPSM